jgi:hypothetical protein
LVILKEGKMTNNELAEWFDMTPGSFRGAKKEKLEELRAYADFYEEKGKIIITDIWNAGPYIKKKSKDYQIVKSSFDKEWNENGIDTCSNVSNKIYEKHENELAIAPSTTYKYTISVRDELYGKPSIGNCHYLWCKKYETEDGTIVLEEFSEEEQAIKKELLKKYFSTDEEQDMWIAQQVDAGEITEQQAYRLTREIRGLHGAGFMAFKKELEERLGCSIIKGTKIDKGNYIGFGEQLLLGE